MKLAFRGDFHHYTANFAMKQVRKTSRNMVS